MGKLICSGNRDIYEGIISGFANEVGCFCCPIKVSCPYGESCVASSDTCRTHLEQLIVFEEPEDDSSGQLVAKTAATQSPTKKESAAGVPFVKIKELYNTICVSLPKIQRIEGERRKAVTARYKTYGGLEDFKTLFTKAEASAFLKGANTRNWRADFDWLMKPNNMAKVLEGKYDNNQQGTQTVGTAGNNPLSDEEFEKEQKRMQKLREMIIGEENGDYPDKHGGTT